MSPSAPRLPLMVTVPAVPPKTAVVEVPEVSVQLVSVVPFDQLLLLVRTQVPVPPLGLETPKPGSQVRLAAFAAGDARAKRKAAARKLSPCRAVFLRMSAGDNGEVFMGTEFRMGA